MQVHLICAIKRRTCLYIENSGPKFYIRSFFGVAYTYSTFSIEKHSFCICLVSFRSCKRSFLILLVFTVIFNWSQYMKLTIHFDMLIVYGQYFLGRNTVFRHFGIFTQRNLKLMYNWKHPGCSNLDYNIFDLLKVTIVFNSWHHLSRFLSIHLEKYLAATGIPISQQPQ